MELEDIVNKEMLTTEDVNNMLEHTDKGRTKQTIRNCVTVLQNDPVLKKAIKRNELSGRMDIVKEVPWERRNNSPTVTDTDENNLKMYLEENYELTSERVIKAGIDIVSNENKYHPIRDYLESLVWDGIPRIENMLPHFLGAEKSKYTIGVMKMHMLAAISRIYEPGIKYDIMLCLVGSQGAGKSTFFKYLAIKEEWFSDNLDHLDDENIYRKLQNHWIIEMGEMKATITAKNIEQIKSFLSRQKETYKVPYEVHPEDRPRQCVFCGTSNDLNFLPLDRTGNRRFAPVMTDMSKAEVHILDNEAESKAYIEQAWAEAMVLYRQGNVFLGFTKEIEEEAKRLEKINIGAGKEVQEFLERHGSTPLKTAATLAELVRRPELSYEALAELDPNRPELPEDVIEQININIKYDGYIRRQLQQVAQFKKMESRKLDENFDYSTVGSLRREAVQKLNLYKPANIGQASRIAGVSPADISVLLVHLEQSRHAGHGEEKKEL